MLGLRGPAGFPPTMESESCRLVVLLWLLTAAFRSLQSRAPGCMHAHGSWALEPAGLGVVAHQLGCSMARGILPDQGLNPRLVHQQVDSLPLSHQGSP